jgi:hypothetical protein
MKNPCRTKCWFCSTRHFATRPDQNRRVQVSNDVQKIEGPYGLHHPVRNWIIAQLDRDLRRGSDEQSSLADDLLVQQQEADGLDAAAGRTDAAAEITAQQQQQQQGHESQPDLVGGFSLTSAF